MDYTSKAKSTYYYDTHTDATPNFKLLTAQHNQRAREEGFFYLNNPASVIEMNPDLPDPFIPSVVMPPSGLVIDLANASRAIYINEKNGYDAREREIKTLRAKHQIISNKAIAALTDILDLKCAARQQMEANLLLLSEEPTHVQYLELKRMFYAEYSPCLPQDAELHLIALKTLSARDGRGYSRYDIEFTQAAQALSAMNQMPLPTIMMKYLYDGTKAVPGASVLLNTMRDGIRADLVPNAVAPAIPRWQTFVSSLGQQLKDFPGDDLVTSITLYVQQPAKSTSDYCIFCGRYGHMKPTCRCSTLGGFCVCGAPIVAGATNHPVTDDAHAKARETSRIKYLSKYASSGRGGHGDGGRGGGGRGNRGGRGGGRDGGRGRGRGGGQGTGRGSDAKPVETADTVLAKLIKRQEEQGLALQVLVRSGIDTRKQIEDALDADIKTSTALTTLEDSTKAPQSGKRKRA
jgi:hypothetical protein